MYGLLNRAIEELVVERSGLATWHAVKRKAGVQVHAFESMESYPDEITYELVAAASEVLGESPTELLRAFGRHWILFTGRSAYGSILEAAGRDLRDFLGNLDAIHASFAAGMPELVPPRFSVSEEPGDTLRILYHSERDGLAPMVLGMLEGLGALFESELDPGSELEVSHVVPRSSTSCADEFLIVAAKREGSA